MCSRLGKTNALTAREPSPPPSTAPQEKIKELPPGVDPKTVKVETNEIVFGFKKDFHRFYEVKKLLGKGVSGAGQAGGPASFLGLTPGALPLRRRSRRCTRSRTRRARSRAGRTSR